MLRNRLRRAGVAFISLISAFIAVTAALVGCELPSIYEYWDSVVLNELEISPSFIALEEGQKASFAALGGKAPFRFELAGDGTLLPMSGARVEYEAPTGGSPQEAQVELRDVYGAVSSARVLVMASIDLLTIAPTEVALGHGDPPVIFTFSGGKPPYRFRLEAGGGSVEMPTTTTGRYTAPAADTDAIVRLEDASGQVADARIVVRDVAQPLAIIPSEPVIIELGATFTFGATGGVLPYTFSVDPLGVGSIDDDSGEYMSTDLGTAVVKVTDADSKYAEATVTVVATSPLPLVINPRSVNLKMGASFQFTGQGGMGSYTFTMASGYGGSVHPDTGLYTAPSSRQGTERVRITDARGISDTATVKVKK